MLSSTATHRVLTFSPISKLMKQNGNNLDDANRIFNYLGWRTPAWPSSGFNQNQKMFLMFLKLEKKPITKAVQKKFTNYCEIRLLQKFIALLRKFNLCFQDGAGKSGNQVY